MPKLSQALDPNRQVYGFYPHLNPKVPGKPDTLNTPEHRGALAKALLSVAPGSGEAMSLRDSWNASGKAVDALVAGDYGQAASEYGNLATALLGALPGAGIVARGTKRGAAWMDENLPSWINRGLDAIVPSDPKNTLNIFAGPTAKTADTQALSKAQEMAGGGANRDDIWRDTGWFQGTDGKWRFEIDDTQAKLSGIEKAPINTGHFADANDAHRKTFNGLDHPGLSAAYNTESLPFSGYYGPGLIDDAHYSGKSDPYISVTASSKNAAKSNALHEMQHHIQEKEGFSFGGSPMHFYDEADTLDDRMELYRRLASEVEARNVQSRMNMTPAERRFKAPWLTQDVPDEQQIVRFR